MRAYSKSCQPITKLANLQALRGIAVAFVVLSHLMSVERKYAGDRLLGDFFSIGFSGVDLFFAISGFVMVYVAWHLPGKMSASASFMFARIGRIYPLYWAVSLAVLAVYFIQPDLVFSNSHKVSLGHSFVLWPADHPPLLAVGWTLIHEMYFYLIFAIMLLFAARFRFFLLALWGVLVVAGFVLGGDGRGPVYTLLTHPLSFEFLGGVLAALAYRRFAGKGWGLALIAGALLFVGAGFLSLKLGLSFWNDWSRAASFTPGCSLLVYGAAGAEKASKMCNRVLVWLGDQSYALYLSHVLSLAAMGRLWALFAIEGPLDNMLMLPVLLIGALIGAEILHRLVELPLLQITKHARASLFRSVS